MELKLQLERPVVIFDIETTGLNITQDRIIEISYIKVYPDHRQEKECLRINPGMPIPKESTKIHHITDDDVRDCPSFEQLAQQLFQVFNGCDIAGFNSNMFDIPVLDEEFNRVGIDFDWSKCHFIDAQTIFHKKEKRDLAAACMFYCGHEMENHHSSMADTQTTYDVLCAQLERYEDLGQKDVAQLSEYSSHSKFADLKGFIIYNEKNQEVVNFGKHKGKVLEEVLLSDHGYADWVRRSDFPASTKRVFARVQQRVREHEAEAKRQRDQQPPTADQLERLRNKFN